MSKEIFNEIIETFENEDIKRFMIEKCLPTVPAYFWEVPSSSTLKYHPAYACTTPLGLAKHTVALVRFLNHMFEVESIANQFTSRERDLLRVAAIAHDSKKSGDQADYEQNKYTKFDHPLRAAKFVQTVDGIGDVEKNLVAHAIMSHMGQWNESKRDPGIILPKPEDKYQIILHLADYLASRKDIEMKFDNVPKAESAKSKTPPDIRTWRIPFGKHKGKTMPEIYAEDPGYIHWAAEKAEKDPFHSFAVQLLEK